MKSIRKFLVLSSILLLLISCSHSGKRKRKNSPKSEINTSAKIVDPPVFEKTEASTLNNLYQDNKEAVFLIYTSDGQEYHQGSGFFISADGIGISNYHVFEGTFKGKELIKLLNGQEYKIAKVLASNKELDYIVFQVEAGGDEKFPFLAISNSYPVIGDNVFAIGNPKGLESTLSTGIISSLRTDVHLIQTTAEITNGSSGGPLFNMNGAVIGITSSGMGEANLNFAVDIRVLNIKL